MTRFSGLFVWAGGVLFVGALLFCGYTFLIVWSRAAALNSRAIVIDGMLFTAFAAHHSVFAREPVKRWATRFVPQPLLRSVYVWAASVLLIVVCAAWPPVGGE